MTTDPTNRISELERELERCEQQLRHRETVIRRLRGELQQVRAEHDRVIASRTYKLAHSAASIARGPRRMLAALRSRVVRSGSTSPR